MEAGGRGEGAGKEWLGKAASSGSQRFKGMMQRSKEVLEAKATPQAEGLLATFQALEAKTMFWPGRKHPGGDVGRAEHGATLGKGLLCFCMSRIWSASGFSPALVARTM